LEALARNRNAAQKHVWRAQIVLLSADGLGTNEIMRRTGKSKTCVWRWQERFAKEGYDGLLRDKTRRSRIPPLDAAVAERVVALTLSDPPAAATHWTAAMMAAATGISVSSVQRIWRRHGLQPHRMRQFKLSNDPQFAAKLRDIVGLYVDPPAHAIVLSLDEKSQIQALDRTQPGLPMKPGRLGTMTHDYKRHGTTTLRVRLCVERESIVEVVALAEVSRDHRGISGLGVSPGQCPAAHCRVGGERLRAKGLDFGGDLHVSQLPDIVVPAIGNPQPTEENVTGRLYETLPAHHTLALVRIPAFTLGRLQHGTARFLCLEKQRVVIVGERRAGRDDSLIVLKMRATGCIIPSTRVACGACRFAVVAGSSDRRGNAAVTVRRDPADPKRTGGRNWGKIVNDERLDFGCHSAIRGRALADDSSSLFRAGPGPDARGPRRCRRSAALRHEARRPADRLQHRPVE
jgi:transposase